MRHSSEASRDEFSDIASRYNKYTLPLQQTKRKEKSRKHNLISLFADMSRLLGIPTELRQRIVALAVWTPKPPPDAIAISQDNRVRLREDWDVWVPAQLPQPATLPLLLTCRTLRDDVTYLLSASSPQPGAYELDIVFIPGCGLFPTWTCCPPRSHAHVGTIHASLRIMDVDDIDDTVRGGGGFATRFRSVSSSFSTAGLLPNPPPGACNFYHLLASCLALGPLGVSSLAYQTRHGGSLSTCRFTLGRLVVSVASKGETELDRDKRRYKAFEARPVGHDHLPYGAGGEDAVFPGPGDDSRYAWTSPTILGDAEDPPWGTETAWASTSPTLSALCSTLTGCRAAMVS